MGLQGNNKPVLIIIIRLSECVVPSLCQHNNQHNATTNNINSMPLTLKVCLQPKSRYHKVVRFTVVCNCQTTTSTHWHRSGAPPGPGYCYWLLHDCDGLIAAATAAA